ncbi:MAG: glycosyltransferase family 39 protein [Bacterioplanes sp.]|nr:glycosyltransferase family 39 protein [Bacterioplanes sp.]
MTRKFPVPIWLVVALAALFFVNLGGFLLFDHDEGAFSEATRGMFERGDFITTYLNDRVRFDKPILIYWLQAAATFLFGFELWAFRLPSALAGMAWALTVYFFVRRYRDESTAVIAALMIGTALGINAISHAATADGVLNAILAATILCIYRYSQNPSSALLYGIYALMAFGVLTKGPVAVVIPLLVAIPFYLLSNLREPLMRALFFFPGWALFVVIAAPWYILEYLDQGQDFIDGFILKHNVERFKDTLENHGGGPLYYPLVLPFVLAPFGALLIRILPSLTRSIRQWRDGNHSDEVLLDRLLWIWFLVVLILFSIASTKLPHYILYGVTPLIILMARYRDWLQSRWFAALFPALFYALLTALPLLTPLIEQQLTNPIEIATAQRAAEYFNNTFAIIALVIGLCSVALIFWRRLRIWQSLILVGGLQILFVWLILVPAASEAQQRPVWNAAQFAKMLDEPIYTQSIDMPSFNVYYGKATIRRPLNVGEVGFARADRVRYPHYDVLFQDGPIVIIRRLDAPMEGNHDDSE